MKIIVLHWYWFLFAKLKSKIFVFLNDEKVVKLEFGNRRVPLVSILWCHMTITFVSRDVLVAVSHVIPLLGTLCPLTRIQIRHKDQNRHTHNHCHYILSHQSLVTFPSRSLKRLDPLSHDWQALL